MEIKFFVHSKCAYTFALAGNSWNAEFICLLLWCRCVCHRVQQNIKKLQMTHAEEKPISLLGGGFQTLCWAQFWHNDQWFVPLQPPYVRMLKRSRRNCRKCCATSTTSRVNQA